MRHRVYGKHLGRNKNERQNLFKGLVYSLFQTGTIQTSEAKAKAIKPLIDKMVTLAKRKHAENQLKAFLTDKDLRERLIKEIVPKLGSKTSGYAKFIRMGTQVGDQTTMVKISLIGAEQLQPIKKEVLKEEKAKTSK